MKIIWGAPLMMLLVGNPATAELGGYGGAAATCSAPMVSRLEPAPAPLSTEERDLLSRLLPHPTSQQAVVSGELRAPFHIPCQLQGFPHLQDFVSESRQHKLPNFELKEFAQPPHLIFFDGAHDVVRTIVVSPTWSDFELRDLILSNLEIQQA